MLRFPAQDYARRAASDWVKRWPNTAKPCLIITGPLGCGKTALAAEVCPAGSAWLSGLKPKLERSLSRVRGAASMHGGCRFSCVVVDDVDACGSDVRAVSALAALASSRTVPVICTCADGYCAGLKSLRDVSEFARLPRPPAAQLASALKLLGAPNPEELALACGGDVRRALAELRFGARAETRGARETAPLFSGRGGSALLGASCDVGDEAAAAAGLSCALAGNVTIGEVAAAAEAASLGDALRPRLAADSEMSGVLRVARPISMLSAPTPPAAPPAMPAPPLAALGRRASKATGCPLPEALHVLQLLNRARAARAAQLLAERGMDPSEVRELSSWPVNSGKGRTMRGTPRPRPGTVPASQPPRK